MQILFLKVVQDMEIQPNRPNEPTYQGEFKRSVDLFDKCFHHAIDTNYNPQKEQYYKAMKEAMTAMQDSATGMVNQHLVDLKKKLESDVKDYMKDPSADRQMMVEADLKELKDASESF
jgi:hypothetical protein